jgi:hypothetical protein
MKKSKILFSILILNFALCQSAQAATLDDVVNSINQLRAYIQGVVETANKLLFEQNPSLPATVVGNVGNKTARTISETTTQTVTGTSIATSLTQQDDKELQRLASLIASDSYLPKAHQWIFSRAPESDPTKFGDLSMSLEALLGTTSYANFNIDDLTKNPAYNFIQFASSAYQPLMSIQLAKDIASLPEEKKATLQNNPDFQKYRAALRSNLAAQSIGLSNLYSLMAKRVPQAGLGTKAGIPDKTNASELEIQQYLASRRSQNIEWYKQMAAASPATVSRESLFVLAEMQQQLFQMQLVNERILATLSMMEMQQNTLNKNFYITPMEIAVKNQVDNALGKKEGADVEEQTRAYREQQQ